jgi:putative heme-binding domain-containing protein
LVQAGVEVPTAIASLSRLPRSAWPKELLAPLALSLVEYLKKALPQERAEAPFTEALQFAADLASLLPPDTAQTLTRTLRSLGPTIVTLHAVYEQMRFDKDLIIVEAGKAVAIALQNDDAMPHNLAILSPGALKEIGLAAEKMSPEPDSEGRLYVPASPKVLHATKLVSPGQKIQLAFNAPAEAGDYPFVCTFPGHWLRMAGTLAVVPDVDAYLASHPLSQQTKLTEWKLADFSTDLPQAALGRNLATGKELFSTLACVQCHKLGPQGYPYGPDLTEVFKRYKNDRAAVLLQILEPSRVIEDRYRNFNFEIKGGEPLLGMVLKEDDQNLTIQTGPADSLIQTLKKSEIQQRRPPASSPMPVGLLNALSESQIFDLLAYLESGGVVPTHEHMH